LDDVILYSGDGQKYTNRDIIEMSEKSNVGIFSFKSGTLLRRSIAQYFINTLQALNQDTF
jgi:hypothetical protein